VDGYTGIMIHGAEILDEFALPSDPFPDQGNLQSDYAQGRPRNAAWNASWERGPLARL